MLEQQRRERLLQVHVAYTCTYIYMCIHDSNGKIFHLMYKVNLIIHVLLFFSNEDCWKDSDSRITTSVFGK